MFYANSPSGMWWGNTTIILAGRLAALDGDRLAVSIIIAGREDVLIEWVAGVPWKTIIGSHIGLVGQAF